ncbi:MAG: glycosyltransferase, partial [Acidimicrobiales bacterium]
LEQRTECEIRVLVHDNASSDGTSSALERHVPEAEVEVSEENLGFARAMNLLMKRSTAPWFFALNSDAWPESGAIDVLVDAGERHQRAAAVAPRLERPDGSLEASTHPFPSLKTALIDLTGGRHWMPRGHLEAMCLEGAWHHDRARSVDWAVGAALLMRRAALEDLGGFDERFFMYAEDLEWCWRARSAAWEVRFEPGALVRHIGNVSGEKRWGGGRLALEAANLRVLLPEMMGRRRAVVFRWVQAATCAERLVSSRVLRRNEDAARWRTQLKAHAGIAEHPPVRACAVAQRTQ